MANAFSFIVILIIIIYANKYINTIGLTTFDFDVRVIKL